MALAFHAGEGSKKGVSLCLWAYTDAHAPVENLRYGSSYSVADDDDQEVDDEDPFLGLTAIYEACAHDHPEILKRLGPDPGREDFDDLYRRAGSGAVIDVLARSALPSNVNSVIVGQIRWLSYRRGEWHALD